MKRLEVSEEVELDGQEVERRVFVQSEPHAALREIATRLLSLTSPPPDVDIQKTMEEVQVLEGEVERVTARVSHAYTGLAHVFQMKGCYQEALHCLHKSKLVLLQCYEDKGKSMPQQVRSGYDTLESNLSKLIEQGIAREGQIGQD